jgi:hypothetical protein
MELNKIIKIKTMLDRFMLAPVEEIRETNRYVKKKLGCKVPYNYVELERYN